MRPTRLTVGLGALLLALLVSSIIAEQQSQRFVPLTSYSSQPDGTRALWLWLEESGYQVQRLEAATFAVEPATGLLFVLEPSIIYEPAHVEELERWVSDGGTLVLAGNRLAIRPLLDRFGLALRAVAPAVEQAEPAQPLFLEPPVEQVALQAPDVLETRRSAAVELLADGERLAAASVEVGNGRVVALASPFPLSNAGLSLADDAALALHLVSLSEPGSAIAFDEYHHGFIHREQRTALDLAVHTAWGWAAMYAGLVTLAYLALSGRRFGRAVPLPRERRRGVAEYVRSVANLYRRAGQRRFIAHHYAQQTRRRLARELGLDPTLPTAELGEWFRRRGAGRPELLGTLERLEGDGPLREAELVRLVQEADREVAEVSGKAEGGRRKAD